jgi:hypothetical protein
MLWAILLLIGLIAFLKLPSFRKVVLIIAGVITLTVIGYTAYDKQQTEASKRLVRFDQLDFTDMRLGLGDYASKLTGRVKNNSKYTVFEVRASIRALDCDQNEKCEVIGEEEQDIVPVVPPGQVRDVDKSIYFSGNTKPRGKFQWNYRITEVRARE